MPLTTGRYLFSLLRGMFVMVFIGWLPIVGPFMSGFTSGATVRDTKEGLKIAFMIGLFGALFSYYLFNLFTLSIIPKSSIGIMLMNMLNYSIGLGPVVLGILVIVFSSIGGIIGSTMASMIEKEGYESGKAKGKDIGNLRKIRNEL